MGSLADSWKYLKLIKDSTNKNTNKTQKFKSHPRSYTHRVKEENQIFWKKKKMKDPGHNVGSFSGYPLPALQYNTITVHLQ